MQTKDERKAYIKEYYQRPEVKKRIRTYEKKHNSNLVIRKNRKKWLKEYRNRKTIKEKLLKYTFSPECKRYMAQYMRDKRKNDKDFRIKCRLRIRLYIAMKSYSENGKIGKADSYGIDYQKIIEHLKPFPIDIHRFHIDHITPLATFNFEDPKQIKEAFAPENHQWLLAKDNLSKGKKVIIQETL